MNKETSIKLFEEQKVRVEWDENQEKWYFSIVDVVAVLTSSEYQTARNYWKVLKHRLSKEGNQTVTNCNQLKMIAPDGKMRLTDVADTEQLLRLIQSIPSPKAEPFKMWLAKVGRERIDEMEDPEITINRALETYLKKGYSEAWVNQRLKSIEIRKGLTDEWDRGGIKKGLEYAILTDEITKAWAGVTTKEYKKLKNLKKENLRLERNIIGPCLGLGISTFVMLSTESILSMSFTSSLAKFGGDLAVGAMTIITSTSQLILMPLQGICQGGQPIISFNYGAKNNERVKKAFFIQLKVCVIFTCISWLIMMLVPQIFAGMFTADKELVKYTAWALRIYMAGIFAMGFQICCQQSFMALGQAKVSLFLACLRKLILLIPLIFILPVFMQDKVFAVFVAEPVSDIIAAAVTTIVFMAKFNGILEKKR